MRDNDCLAPGSWVRVGDEECCVEAILSLNSILLRTQNGLKITATLSQIDPMPRGLDDDVGSTTEVPDFLWEEAKKREGVIKLLEQARNLTLDQAKEAASSLGVSWRTIYRWIKKYRSSGALSSLVQKKPTGGHGKGRLDDLTESIIQEVIEELYLSKQKRNAQEVITEVRRRCKRANLRLPGANTIRRRIAALNGKKVTLKRHGYKEYQKQKPISGQFPRVEVPLRVVQIDHTVVDIIIVDEFNRLPIGRPYLTIGIDVFSRCITGFALCLEPPSSVSVGLCLAHSIIDKTSYLAELEVSGEWPVRGKPEKIFVDNAPEFHSDALRRGCEQHGIEIGYRPSGTPHYGGIVERVIGTFMNKVHSLPGTTFSSVKEKGDYPSEKKAVLTLKELEKWFALSITQIYHNEIHQSLNESPLAVYKRKLLEQNSLPPLESNPRQILIDFLPVIRRSVRRYGFMIDHISYFSNALRPFIWDKEKYGKFTIRRDPRDISRVYVLDAKDNEYLEVPYRNLSRPSISLWEHRESLKHLKDQGIKNFDEDKIFSAIEEIRVLREDASKKSRVARRKKEIAKGSQKTSQSTDTKPKHSQVATSDELWNTVEKTKPITDREIW